LSPLLALPEVPRAMGDGCLQLYQRTLVSSPDTSQKTMPPSPGYTRADHTAWWCSCRGARRLFHVFELRAIFERRGDKRGTHRVRRVAAIEPERAGIFAHHAVAVSRTTSVISRASLLSGIAPSTINDILFSLPNGQYDLLLRHSRIGLSSNLMTWRCGCG
jgi:hypothetical protein